MDLWIVWIHARFDYFAYNLFIWIIVVGISAAPNFLPENALLLLRNCLIDFRLFIYRQIFDMSDLSF